MVKDRTDVISDLTEGGIPRQLIVFSFPFMMANLLQAFYSIADMAIVGQFVGSVGLSAVSISGQVMTLLTLVGIACASGGQILIGQLVGAKDRDGMASTVHTLLISVSLVAVLLTVLGLCIYRYALDILNTPAEAVMDAQEYLRISCFGIFFIFAYNGVCGILRGWGDSRRPLLFIAIASVVNLVLDLIFVAVLGMGVRGAAIATVIGQAVALFASFAYLYRQREEIGIDFRLRSVRMDTHKLVLLAKLGAPLALMQVCIHVSMLIISASINEYGLVAAAVNGVGNKLYGVVTTVSSAMTTATATMVAQNTGARKPERAAQTVYCALGIDAAFFVIIALVSWFFPRQIFCLFDSDPAVLDTAVSYMRISIIMYAALNFMAPLLGLMQGVGAVHLSLFVSILDSVVARLGLSFLLANLCGMGLNGFFLGTALAGLVSVIVPGIYFIRGKWREKHIV